MENNIISFVEYLSKEKKYSSHTITAYENDLLEFKDFIEVEFKCSLNEVQYNLIRAWIVSLVEGGVSNKTINRKISSLKSYYKFLLKIKKIAINPLLKHKSLKVPKKVQIPFSEKELEQVFELNDFSNNFEGIRNRLVIELFYATGIRKSELIELKIKNVDLKNKTLKVLGKRNKERILPLLDCTISIIESYLVYRFDLEMDKDSDVLILSKTGNKLSQSFVYRLINVYFSSVSQKTKKSPHVLRHSFATHLLNNGADLNSVKELLGHASLSSTQIYTHSSLAELQKVYKDSHPRG
ncbi:tyrosine-type recombinase/integrase [Flavobacterium okayamense]|uniref:Tyrosine recombinase XerC n=1 Tax=Flavobacterium okayamense TaxID=2830782 RepID=A0ABN6HVG1_9FLAO|nr:tyrosine-type recombinase/integrase [Flavobacterium okayamense]BCY28440.1 integrase [Flavobacterium okayamense]